MFKEEYAKIILMKNAKRKITRANILNFATFGNKVRHENYYFLKQTFLYFLFQFFNLKIIFITLYDRYLHIK